MPSNNKGFKSWVEISQSALKSNLKIFRSLVGKSVKIACVVKANAYGHGLAEVVRILDGLNTDFFAVDNISEALIIRDQGVSRPIFILGYVPMASLSEAIENDISFVVYNTKTLKKIRALGLNKKAKIHLKIETGLNRQGLKGKELVALASLAGTLSKYITIEGASTHFANIEDTLDSSYALFQLENFKKETQGLTKSGIKDFYLHAGASAAALLYPQTRFDLVRLGIALYGFWPSREAKIAFSLAHPRVLGLRPVLSWKSLVAQVKRIKKGESVGYGRTWFAPRNSKIAIVPVGYSDGYDRKLSQGGRVLINGSYAPVIGRVAMNMIALDVTDTPRVSLEDEVILIGKSGLNEVSAEELAVKISTINYEIVARINPLLPRFIEK